MARLCELSKSHSRNIDRKKIPDTVFPSLLTQRAEIPSLGLEAIE